MLKALITISYINILKKDALTQNTKYRMFKCTCLNAGYFRKCGVTVS